MIKNLKQENKKNINGYISLKKEMTVEEIKNSSWPFLDGLKKEQKLVLSVGVSGVSGKKNAVVSYLMVERPDGFQNDYTSKKWTVIEREFFDFKEKEAVMLIRKIIIQKNVTNFSKFEKFAGLKNGDLVTIEMPLKEYENSEKRMFKIKVERSTKEWWQKATKEFWVKNVSGLINGYIYDII